jgi:dynein heavy chain
MPGGNALLVGVGGSGRQSVSRLAAYISGCTVKQIEISKNYGNVEWREDLKVVLREAGTSDSPMVFLFSDTQIKRESMVEDINNMLNSGEVPNLFPNDEKVAICEAVRPFAKEVFGRAAQDMTQIALYTFFVQRVRSQLHIVLAFSPIGDAFRDRLRKFPSLVNCCAIDWFTAWPDDALVAVAEKFLADVECDSDALRKALVDMCQMFHENTRELSEEFMSKLKRINYVTPTSYLELIIAFKTSLGDRRTDVAAQKRRYEVGLEKLEFATLSVNNMQKELVDLQPVLERSQKETDELM